MLGLALAVVGIALPDSLNPTLIVAAGYIALGPHPTRRLFAFTAGAFAVTLAGGLVIALGLGDLILSLLPKLSRSLKYELMTAVGVGLIIGGGVIWWRRESLASEKPSAGGRSIGGSALVIGAGIAGVEFLSAFPYFAAIAMIVGASINAPSKVFLLVLYNVIYVLPLIAMTIISAVMGDRAGQVLAPMGDWVATRWPVVVAPLASLAGVAVTVYALIALL